MTGIEFHAILPTLWVGAASVLLLLLAPFRRSPRMALSLALAGFAGGLASLPSAWSVIPTSVTPLLRMDGLALYFQALILVSGAAVAVLAREYLARRGVVRPEEFMALLLFSVVGAMVLVAARHLAAFFLGLEILSMGLYGMIAYLHDGVTGLDAGIKYLVLAGASSGFLLFGMSLLYLETGSLTFAELSRAAGGGGWSPTLLVGTALVAVGIGFKLALVPFHLWTPDVYQGASAPVTAFLAGVSKVAVVAVLLRVVVSMPGFGETRLWTGLAGLAVASMIAGNLLALLQDDVKRILAYSSIAHLGYLLVPVLAGGTEGVAAAVFYATAYTLTTLAAFGSVAALSRGEAEEGRLDRFRGLWKSRPLLALILGAALFSLAGIPFTAGFVGKFFLLEAGMRSDLQALALVLAGTSVIGLFYYLRVVVALFVEPGAVLPREEDPASLAIGDQSALGWTATLVLALLLLVVVGIGVWPGPLVEIIRGGAVLFLPGGG